MPGQHYPDVYVKAVAITRGELILTVFNEKWGAFTLPMSKTRTWPDPDRPGEVDQEKPEVTAIRAAVEALGRPLGSHELPRRHAVHTLDPYNQSGRDGVWKCYHIEVFQLELDPGDTPKPLGGAPMAWMTPEQMETLKPVSDTARYIARSMTTASSLPDGA
jgi:hypothetical protein